ncbi:YgjV family protein [Aquimarina mytili]|uniref:YgjV family protein n=1 Tax=Aquimarina mytili TaxID=874423 RepID=A0A937A6K6_9FLAO|nr:YgjV family protein [Aquimarina mytili]MBL0685805.1 YgjV family protein [Aquimarina mytili]
MDSIIINAIGYIGLTINLYSMSVKGEYKLRIISTLANTIYIVYGILLNAYPIIIGCSIAVLLHIYRLKNLKPKKDD